MQTKHLIELILLAAIWSASFLFMRIATPEFGPIALAEVRTLSAALFLLPFLYAGNQYSVVLKHWRPILVIAIITTVLPYSLLSYTTLYAPAGYAAILNATVPMFSAVVAYFWLKEGIGLKSQVGLLVGFLGVFVLAMDDTSLDTSAGRLPVIAALVAAFGYGLGANYTKVKLSGVGALAISAGSQFFSALILLPFAIYFWPAEQPGGTAWISVIVLGVVCTGITLVMFYRLIGTVGPTKAVMVAYLIPVFGLLWGYLFLGEIVTPKMVLGGLLTLAGVAFTTGSFRSRTVVIEK